MYLKIFPMFPCTKFIASKIITCIYFHFSDPFFWEYHTSVRRNVCHLFTVHFRFRVPNVVQLPGHWYYRSSELMYSRTHLRQIGKQTWSVHIARCRTFRNAQRQWRLKGQSSYLFKLPTLNGFNIIHTRD